MTRPLRRSLRFSTSILIIVTIFVYIALAEPIPVDKFDPIANVPVTSATSPSPLPASGTAIVKVIIAMPEGYHITSRDNGFFELKVRDTLDLKFGEWKYPAMQKFEKDEVFQGKIIIQSTVKIAGTSDWKELKLPLAMGYQICAETGAKQCFMPTDREVRLVLRKGNTSETAYVAPVVPPTPSAPTPTSPPIQTDTAPKPETVTTATSAQPVTSTPAVDEPLEVRFQNALKSGSWIAFLLVFLGGVLGSLTPCVYPVIPITMGYIGSRSGGSKLRGFTLSLAFVLGLAIVYSTLGLLAASTGALFGSFTQTPWFMGPIAAIIAIMGVSMLGVFDIPIPGFAAEAQGKTKGGYFGAAVMGGLSGLVAAPCVGPVLVALLAWVAQSGSLAIGFFMLFTFSLGMGLLFIVIGTFSGMLQALPSAGEWMVAVKKFFGMALLAGALFLVRAYLPASLLYLLWSVLLAFSGILLWGKPLSADDDLSLGTAFSRAVAVLLLITAMVAILAVTMPLFELNKLLTPAPVAITSSSAQPEAGLPWLRNDETGALAKAKAENKPVLIDFYADWCAACVELDEKTWPDAGIKQAVGGFVLLKFDFTKQNETTKALMTKYRIQGLPTVLLLTPNGEERNRFAGFKAPAETIQWIQSTKF